MNNIYVKSKKCRISRFWTCFCLKKQKNTVFEG